MHTACTCVVTLSQCLTPATTPSVADDALTGRSRIGDQVGPGGHKRAVSNAYAALAPSDPPAARRHAYPMHCKQPSHQCRLNLPPSSPPSPSPSPHPPSPPALCRRHLRPCQPHHRHHHRRLHRRAALSALAMLPQRHGRAPAQALCRWRIALAQANARRFCLAWMLDLECRGGWSPRRPLVGAISTV